MSGVRAAAGDVVAYWDGAALAIAVSGGEEKQRLRLVGPDGRETRVPAGRVAIVVERGGPSPGKDDASRRAAAERAAASARRIAERAAGVDVETLGELVAGSGPTAVVALADLALGADDGEACAAVVRALLDDGVRFVRKGDAWDARDAAIVATLLHEREAAARRAAERGRALAALERIGRGEAIAAGEAGPELERFLAAARELALDELGASDASREIAAEALAAARVRGDRPSEAAFRLLRLAGRLASDDVNLAAIRLGLVAAFPEAVEAAARRAAAAGFSRDGREDLTGLEVVTIDAATTREIDDGLSVEPLAGRGFRVGVHIADPGAFVAPGDAIDLEARSRGQTQYFPEGRYAMLPAVLSEDAASLVAGGDRPSLSFLAEIAPDGGVAAWRVARAVVRPRARLTYDDVDAAIASGDGRWVTALRDLDAAAAALQAAREAAGAVRIEAPEVDVRVGPDGAIALERLEGDSRARRLVTEAMVLAGRLAAEFCVARGVPAVYRRQPPPDAPFDPPRGPARDPVAVRALRRVMKRGEVGTRPGRHFGLGLDAYAQATSPIRRYQDLVTERQIAAALAGEPPPYDEEAMQRVAAVTDRADAEARRAEREVERYWLLRWLERRAGVPLEGTVVEGGPRPVVLLDVPLLEVTVPSLAGAAAGDRVRLEVVRVNPRADLATLAPIEL